MVHEQGDYQTALEKSKEAGKRERLLCKHREQAGLGDQMNVELTFAVCFNLGYQFQANGLHSEALSTYSQIVKNKQFTQGGRLRVNMGNIYYGQQKYTMAIKMYHMALDQTPNSYKETRYRILRNIGNAFMRLGQYQDSVLSYEAIMEIKIDHQTCYNLIICYYVLGHTEKMKTCFTKMILVRNYDADSDDENEDTAMLRVCSRCYCHEFRIEITLPKGSTLIAILSSYLSVEYIGVEHDRILQVLSCSETL
jgi:intraflagellar transport protein 88